MKIGTIGCPETSVRNYRCTLHNIPKWGSSHLHLGGSVTSCILELNPLFMFTHHTLVSFEITSTCFLIFRQRKEYFVMRSAAASVATISLQTISRCPHPVVLTSTDSTSQYGYGGSMAIFRIVTIIKVFCRVLYCLWLKYPHQIKCFNF